MAYASLELQINSYRGLTSRDQSRLLDANELYHGHGQKQASQIALKATFDWLSLAIAQQTFLGGDMLLPFISIDGFGKYEAPDISRKQLSDEPQSRESAHDPDRALEHGLVALNERLALAHYLLGHNPILLQNAVRYRIYSRITDGIAEKRLTAFGYAWAYSHPETPIYLQTLLKDVLQVEYVEKKASDMSVPATGWYSKYVFTDYTSRGREANEVTLMVPLPPIEDVTDEFRN